MEGSNDSQDHRDRPWRDRLLHRLLAHRRTATPSNPDWALAILVGLVVALIWPWIMGLIIVRRARQRRQNEIDEEVAKQLAQQQNTPPRT